MVSLVIVVSAVLVISCGQIDTYTNTQTGDILVTKTKTKTKTEVFNFSKTKTETRMI